MPGTRLTIAALALALVLAGAWVWSSSLDGVLVLDDPAAITFNPTIRAIGTSLSPPPNTTVSGRPIANLSFAIDQAIAPDSVRAHHLTNIAIHLLAALALFGIVRRTLRTPRLARRFGDQSAPLAFAVAALWMLHPIQTQAVTYVVQRVESLMGLFYVATVYSAIRAIAGRAWLWTTGALIACALGMATKETMVTAPVAVWLWYWTFSPAEARTPRRWVSYLLPATWLVLGPLVLSAPRGQTAGVGVGGWTPWMYLVTETGVIAHYLRLLIVPAPLVFSYAWSRADSLAEVWPQAALVVSLGVLAVWGIARRHPLGFAGGWFYLTLAPTSSVIPIATEVAAEHRLYLASAALVAAVVIGGWWIITRIVRAPRPAQLCGAACGLAIALAFGVDTRARNLDYTSEERLWRDNVEKQPESPRGQLGYGLALMAAGRYADAERPLRAAVSLEEANPLAHRSLGLTLAARNSVTEAIPHLELALRIGPDDIVAHRVLGQIYANRRDDAPAVAHFARVLAVTPDDAATLDAMARLMATTSDAALRDPATLMLTARVEAALRARLAAYAKGK